MSLDHLERLALAAGFAAVPPFDSDDDAAFAPERPGRAVRYKTPDAPAARPASRALALIGPTTTSLRVAATGYVGTALRTAQGLFGQSRAHA